MEKSAGIAVLGPSFDAAFFDELTGGSPIQRELQAVTHALFRVRLTVDVLPPDVPHRARWLALWQDAQDALLTRMAGAATGSALPTRPAAEALMQVGASLFAAKWGEILKQACGADRWAIGSNRWKRLTQALWQAVMPPTASTPAIMPPDEQALSSAVQQAWNVVVAARNIRAPVEPALQHLMRALQPAVVAMWQQLLEACEVLDGALAAQAGGQAQRDA